MTIWETFPVKPVENDVLSVTAKVVDVGKCLVTYPISSVIIGLFCLFIFLYVLVSFFFFLENTFYLWFLEYLFKKNIHMNLRILKFSTISGVLSPFPPLCVPPTPINPARGLSVSLVFSMGQVLVLLTSFKTFSISLFSAFIFFLLSLGSHCLLFPAF